RFGHINLVRHPHSGCYVGAISWTSLASPRYPSPLTRGTLPSPRPRRVRAIDEISTNRLGLVRIDRVGEGSHAVRCSRAAEHDGGEELLACERRRVSQVREKAAPEHSACAARRLVAQPTRRLI